ncbi:MAG: pyrimidine dimer DNA glycosylase/endonuclease V [Gemmatimonadetes bacterium]|nr:pyrimidine dimer DNA glycosylase/endonuclease V [Gemmatimonadota bacterium]
MRLWSLDPSYLDAKGLLALWREGLLARAVLRGATKGYRHHPQLTRFREQPAPVSAINAYLRYVMLEAESRGYRFDRGRLGPVRRPPDMAVSSGQLRFEAEHLRSKLRSRDPRALARLDGERDVRAHPLFRVEDGPVAEWERGAVREDLVPQGPRRRAQRPPGTR